MIHLINPGQQWVAAINHRLA